MAVEWMLVVILLLGSVAGGNGINNVEILPRATIGLQENVNDSGGYVTIHHNATAFQGFKIINRINDAVYIGGRESLYIINGTEIIKKTILTCEDAAKVLKCSLLITADLVDKFCHNYIRIAEEIGGNMTLVCGTNSDTPLCYKINLQSNLTQTCNDASIDALYVAQFLVIQNSTAIYHDGALHVGLNEQRQKDPARIAKYVIAGDRMNLVSRSIENDKSVNEPDFVGKPYIKDGFIYYFYRETAVEAINQGKFVYSRVARVCLNDAGYSSGQHFISYFKARLNCSLQGQYPFYFNYIQDVAVQEAAGEVYFHAVFTTTPHGPPSSAVCTYRLSDIISVFDTSNYKGEESPQDLPSPLTRRSFSGKYTNCNLDFNNLESGELEFLKKYSLMDSLVPNYNAYIRTAQFSDKPLFYSNSMNFYSIAVDAHSEIYYIGTESGAILKAFYNTTDVQSYSMDTAKIKSAVVGLEFVNATKSLIVTTDFGIYSLPLTYCKAACEKECDEFYHNYCEYNNNQCELKNDVSVGESLNVSLNVKILSSEMGGTIESCNGRSVELTCEVKSSGLCGGALLTWELNGTSLVTCDGSDDCQGENSTVAHLVQYTKIASNEHYKLVHLTVQVYEKYTVGEYRCRSRNSGATVNVTIVSSKGCLTKDLYKQRCDRHDSLEEERDELLNKCGKNEILDMSKLMFQTCDQCQGGPDINPSVT